MEDKINEGETLEKKEEKKGNMIQRDDDDNCMKKNKTHPVFVDDLLSLPLRLLSCLDT